MDVRRQLADTKYEKEKYNNSNKELREHIKQIESERREQGRTLEELYQKIAGRLFLFSVQVPRVLWLNIHSY